MLSRGSDYTLQIVNFQCVYRGLHEAHNLQLLVSHPPLILKKITEFLNDLVIFHSASLAGLHRPNFSEYVN